MSKQSINEQPKVGEWIPCSERLPDKEMDTDEDGLATVETTVILPNGELTTFIDDYMFNTGEFCTPYQVIAWRERPEPYREGDEVKKQTNADKIRNMTDEELAKEITEKIECTQCPYNDDYETCGVVECEKLFLDWLQSEADQKGQEL